MVACLPGLATAPRNPYPLWFAGSLLLWCAFMLWAFVFAWHSRFTGRPVFKTRFEPGLWLAATLYGVACGALALFLTDPPLRRILPTDFPSSLHQWVAMSMFQAGFVPLFMTFAPFAFFMRMTRRQSVSLALTVLCGVGVMTMRLRMLDTLPPLPVAATLLVMRVVGGYVVLYFYLNGGALLVWWAGLLVQARLLLDVAAGR